MPDVITETTRLWLFDIDGTLVAPSEDQLRAWLSAFREAFGLELSPPAITPHLGRTFAEVVRAVAEAHAQPVSASHISLALSTYLRHVRDALAIRPGRLLPGAKDLLQLLRGRGDVVGVVTGNFPQEGEPKLEGVGLQGLLDLVIYADLEMPARDSLIRQALSVARARGFPGDFADTVVVGDSVHDVASGRHTGAFSIAVCTGLTPRHRLAEAAPDLLVADLRELLTLLSQTGGRCLTRAPSG